MTRPDPISLRLPDELKDQLTSAAATAGRSLNAEIRMRLEFSFAGGFDGMPSDKMLGNEISSLSSEFRGEVDHLKAAIAELERRLRKLETA
jgi:plasmid stability protein